jgi:hypothetical protein
MLLPRTSRNACARFCWAEAQRKQWFDQIAADPEPTLDPMVSARSGPSMSKTRVGRGQGVAG